MRINFNIPQITTKFINLKAFKTKQITQLEKAMPLVSIPLVAYYVGENADNALANLIKKCMS